MNILCVYSIYEMGEVIPVLTSQLIVPSEELPTVDDYILQHHNLTDGHMVQMHQFVDLT